MNEPTTRDVATLISDLTQELSDEAMKLGKAILQNEYDLNRLHMARERIRYICRVIGGSERELLSNAQLELEMGN
jgi:predicted ATPase